MVQWSGLPLNSEACIQFQAGQCGICGGKSCTGTVFFFQVVLPQSSCVSIIPPVVCTHLYEENQQIKQNTFNSCNRSNCEQFYISFFYIVPLQHNAFFISFNQFLYSCGEEAFRLFSKPGVPSFLHFLIGSESATAHASFRGPKM